MTIRTVLARTSDSLLSHQEAWQDLAENAAERNIFYEPCPLIAALKHFGPSDDFLALLAYDDETLIGFFPHRIRSKLIGSNLLEFYRHRHSFLHTPLLRQNRERDAIESWLDWCQEEIGAAVIMATGITDSGPMARMTKDCIETRSGSYWRRNSYNRPFMTMTGEGEAYVRKSLGGKVRRELVRRRRRLEERGRFELRRLAPGDDIDPWINAFIDLEQSGWKGKNRSAIGSDPQSASFFTDLTRGLHKQGKMTMLGLVLDDHWIAMNCILQAAGTKSIGFGFKSAYDEDFKESSPSNILLMDVIQLLNGPDYPISCLDSCARAENRFTKRILGEERDITTLSIGLPGMRGRIGLSALQWALSVKSAWTGNEDAEPSDHHKAGRTKGKS